MYMDMDGKYHIYGKPGNNKTETSSADAWHNIGSSKQSYGLYSSATARAASAVEISTYINPLLGLY